MKVTVLKPFPYAHDGANIVELKPNDVAEIHDDLIEGLAEEGYVGEPGSTLATTPSPVEIPENWRELTWFKQLAIARKLTSDAIANKPAAIAIIESELALRGRQTGA